MKKTLTQIGEGALAFGLLMGLCWMVSGGSNSLFELKSAVDFIRFTPY